MRTITSLSVFLAVSTFLVASGLLAPKTVSADGILESIPDKTVQELSTLSFVATSTVIDQQLQFSLSEGYPAGATVDNYGLFSWTPTAEQGPGSYFITIVASGWINDFLTELGTSTFSVTVLEPDTAAPFTTIANPLSGSTIEDYFVTISGNTTDNVGVASTTLRFAPYLSFEQQNYCDWGSATDVVTLNNSEETSVFNWTYNWTLANGVYCIEAYGVDVNGNDESNADRNRVEVDNISFTRRADPVPTPEPAPAPSRNGGRRHPATFGEVLGEATSTTPVFVPQITVQSVSVAVADSVKIAWQTNLPATSQVVYGPTASGPFRLSLDKTNFGYPSATAEDATLITNHLVTLQNIVAGQSYSLRVVSKTNAYSFGPEYRFTLSPDGTVKFEGVYGNEIAIGGPSQSWETLEDFVKTNEDKIKALFAN